MSPAGDGDEDEDDDIFYARRSFLRPIESPSPGSSVVGSATSNDVGQLDLQLCFIDFNNGRKVMVTLDMTCLESGIYPSDILPYQLEASIAWTCMPVPESLSDIYLPLQQIRLMLLRSGLKFSVVAVNYLVTNSI